MCECERASERERERSVVMAEVRGASNTRTCDGLIGGNNESNVVLMSLTCFSSLEKPLRTTSGGLRYSSTPGECGFSCDCTMSFINEYLSSLNVSVGPWGLFKMRRLCSAKVEVQADEGVHFGGTDENEIDWLVGWRGIDVRSRYR